MKNEYLTKFTEQGMDRVADIQYEIGRIEVLMRDYDFSKEDDATILESIETIQTNCQRLINLLVDNNKN